MIYPFITMNHAHVINATLLVATQSRFSRNHAFSLRFLWLRQPGHARHEFVQLLLAHASTPATHPGHAAIQTGNRVAYAQLAQTSSLTKRVCSASACSGNASAVANGN